VRQIEISSLFGVMKKVIANFFGTVKNNHLKTAQKAIGRATVDSSFKNQSI
jgi:hypothetical protein